MNREEAIAILNHKVSACLHGTEWGEALDMAISALEQEPCNTDTCKVVKAYMNEWDKPNNSDAISRQTVLDGVASIAKAKARSDEQKALMGRVMFFTEHLSSVNPQDPLEVEATKLQKAYNKGFEDCRQAVLDKMKERDEELSSICPKDIKDLPYTSVF